MTERIPTKRRPILGWRDVLPDEALSLDMPVRGSWQCFGLNILGWSFSFLWRDVSDDDAGMNAYQARNR